MFKISDKTNKIFITKGDNASLTVCVYDGDNAERPNYEDDVITLTVKKSIDSDDVALTKTAENGVIKFVPDDTKSLATGRYFYDIQLKTFGGSIYTVIPVSVFEIGQEITTE